MHILKTPTLVCQNSENIYLTFVAYSSNMTSEITQFTVFSRLCQKSHIFRLCFNSEAQCNIANKFSISTSDVYLWDTYKVAIWILFAKLLYICKKNKEVKIYIYAPFLTIFINHRKVIDFFLHHISETCTYFEECHISRGFAHSILQNYSNYFPKIG